MHHDTRQVRYFGYPSAILLPFNFDFHGEFPTPIQLAVRGEADQPPSSSTPAIIIPCQEAAGHQDGPFVTTARSFDATEDLASSAITYFPREATDQRGDSIIRFKVIEVALNPRITLGEFIPRIGDEFARAVDDQPVMIPRGKPAEPGVRDREKMLSPLRGVARRVKHPEHVYEIRPDAVVPGGAEERRRIVAVRRHLRT